MSLGWTLMGWCYAAFFPSLFVLCVALYVYGRNGKRR